MRPNGILKKYKKKNEDFTQKIYLNFIKCTLKDAAPPEDPENNINNSLKLKTAVADNNDDIVL